MAVLLPMSDQIFKAKLLLLPCLFILFLVFIGGQLKSYLEQEPLLANKLTKPTQYPLPGFIINFPWNSTFENTVVPANLIPQVPDFPLLFQVNGQSQSMNQYFSIQKYDWGTATTYLIKPIQPFITQPYIFQFIYNPFDTAVIPNVATVVWLLGSRFTERGVSGPNAFGFDPDILNTSYIDEQRRRNPSINENLVYGLYASQTNVRDLNYLFRAGSTGQFIANIKSYKYNYLNLTDEYFFEMQNSGQSVSAFTNVLFTYSWEQQSEYTEYLILNSITVLGTVMAAFQFLLITAFIFLFGRGKYNPYGFIHFVLPGTPLKPYEPSSDFLAKNPTPQEREYDRLKFIVDEFMDLYPHGGIDGRRQSLLRSNRQSASSSWTMHEVASRFKVSSLLEAGSFFLLPIGLVLLAIVVAGSYKWPAIHMMRVEIDQPNASQIFLISLNGFCSSVQSVIQNCKVYGFKEMFSNFQLSPIQELNNPNPNWTLILYNESFSIGIFLIILTAGLCMLTVLVKLAGYLQSLRRIARALVPLLAMLYGVSCLVTLACFIYHYIATINAMNRSRGLDVVQVRATLGNGFSIIICGIFVLLVSSILLVIDYVMKRRIQKRIYANRKTVENRPQTLQCERTFYQQEYIKPCIFQENAFIDSTANGLVASQYVVMNHPEEIESQVAVVEDVKEDDMEEQRLLQVRN